MVNRNAKPVACLKWHEKILEPKALLFFISVQYLISKILFFLSYNHSLITLEVC